MPEASDSPTKTSKMPTFQIPSGGREQLSLSQKERAKFFFRINLDMEMKDFVTWEDVEFYILFHITASGHDIDTKLEELLNQRTKEAWNVIHDNWPDTDEGCISLPQFMDTWASIAQYIKSEDKLPEWVENWIEAGFKLYDVKGDGRIRPSTLMKFHMKMGVSPMMSTATYHTLLEEAGGPLTLKAILNLTKRLIITEDDGDVSTLLLPGYSVNFFLHKFEQAKTSSANLSAKVNGNPVVVEPSSIVEEKPQPIQKQREEQAMPSPKASVPTVTPSFNRFPTTTGLNTNPPKTKSSQQPAMKQHVLDSQSIPILLAKQPEPAYSAVTSQNARQSPNRSERSNDLHNWNKPHSFQNKNVQQRNDQNANISGKNDRGFICKILREMNINPSECEILIDENGHNIRSGGGFASYRDKGFNTPGPNQRCRWQPVVGPENRQWPGVRTRPPHMPMYAHRPPIPPNVHNPCLFEQRFKPGMQPHGNHRLPNPLHPPVNPHFRSNMGPFPRAYSSIPNSLDNVSRIGPDDVRRNQFVDLHTSPSVRHMATTTGPQQVGRWQGKPLVDDAFIEEVIKRATPIIQRIVHDEVMKHVRDGAKSTFLPPKPNGTFKTTMEGEHIRPPPDLNRHEQNKEKDNVPQFKNGRQMFPSMPDDYEYALFKNTLQGDLIPPKIFIRKDSEQPPKQITEELSDENDPTTQMGKREADTDNDFWRGESGQSPTVNKMIFDRLLKRQHKMKGSHKSPDDDDNGAEGNNDGADHSDDEVKAFQKSTGGDGTEVSDNTLEDEMLFIPGIGAYPPFISMGMDDGFLQSGGFMPPPFMMAMGPSVFAAQAGDFSPDMEANPPGMDGVFIVMDDKAVNGTDIGHSNQSDDADT